MLFSSSINLKFFLAGFITPGNKAGALDSVIQTTAPSGGGHVLCSNPISV